MFTSISIGKLLTPGYAASLPNIIQLATELEVYVSHNAWPADFQERRAAVLSNLGITGDRVDFFRVPILKPEACSTIVDYAKRFTYAPNLEEEPEYQMHEVVLKHHDLDAHCLLQAVFEYAIQPLIMLVNGVKPTKVNSIQLAKYLPSDKPCTGWHYDADSSCTVTIELTNAQHGACLHVFPNVNVGAAAAGVATFFNGRNLLHRSDPAACERNLLVYWTEHEI